MPPLQDAIKKDILKDLASRILPTLIPPTGEVDYQRLLPFIEPLCDSGHQWSMLAALHSAWDAPWKTPRQRSYLYSARELAQILKLQVLLGLGNLTYTIPAFFWSHSESYLAVAERIATTWVGFVGTEETKSEVKRYTDIVLSCTGALRASLVHKSHLWVLGIRTHYSVPYEVVAGSLPLRLDDSPHSPPGQDGPPAYHILGHSPSIAFFCTTWSAFAIADTLVPDGEMGLGALSIPNPSRFVLYRLNSPEYTPPTNTVRREESLPQYSSTEVRWDYVPATDDPTLRQILALFSAAWEQELWRSVQCSLHPDNVAKARDGRQVAGA